MTPADRLPRPGPPSDSPALITCCAFSNPRVVAMLPNLYVDPQSPYAYLAARRAAHVLGVPPRLRVVLLGAIFHRRGHGSWAHTESRAANVAELGRRASERGLPPFRWPSDWPAQSVAPARAATWAVREGAGEAYLAAYWHEVFGVGRPPADEETIRDAAATAGLDADGLLTGLQAPDVKQMLREETDAAWDRGVRIVPTVELDGELHEGDDALDALATRP